MASALISIRGGHWPKQARLLSDWLRGRQPGLIFPRGPRPARSRRRAGCGRGAPRLRTGGRGRERGSRSSASPRPRGSGREPRADPFLLPRPPAALSPRFGPLRGAGRTENLSPVSSRGLGREAHLLPGVTFPSGFPGDSSLPTRGLLAQAPRLWGPFTGTVPRGLWAPASWALPLTEASLSTLLLAPRLVPGDSLAFPAYCRTKPLFPVSPDPHLATSSPPLPKSSALTSSSGWTLSPAAPTLQASQTALSPQWPLLHFQPGSSPSVWPVWEGLELSWRCLQEENFLLLG